MVLALACAVPAAHADETITSPGPIKEITLGADLSCQVSYGDTSFEFYPPDTAPGDCGTFVAADGDLYAPDFSSHGTTATTDLGGSQITFTPVSQTGVAGTGSPADPYRVETVARAGTAVEVRQRVTYVTGESSYRVDTALSNLSGSDQSTRLFYAGDCYASGSDIGYGFTRPEVGSVGCSQTEDNAPPGRTVQYSPLSAGSSFLESRFWIVWKTIGESPFAAFPDTCLCDESLDNGAGLSWNVGLAPLAAQERSLKVSFTEAERAAPPTDTDGDALPDAWETGGGQQSDETNLAPLGADPNRRDIFVHADHMAGCAPPSGWEQKAISMFAARGIALHIDSGPTSINADGQPWGGRSRAGTVAFVDQLAIQDNWAAFDDLKDTHFVPANRRRAFHYVVFANTYSAYRNGAVTRSDGGISRGIPDADMLIANCGINSSWSPRADDVVLVHELGHNLGLGHGGRDANGAEHTNFKPNHYSLMNYSWARLDMGRGTLTDFSDHRRPDLDEPRVSERAGIQTPAIWWCGLQQQGQYRMGKDERVGVQTDLDLDCDGKKNEGAGDVEWRTPNSITIPGTDIGLVSDFNQSDTEETLVGSDDWTAIVFGGGGIVGALDLPQRQDAPLAPDITSEDVAEAVAAAQQAEQAQAKQLVVTIKAKKLRKGKKVAATVRVLLLGRPVKAASVSVKGAQLARGSKRKTDKKGRLRLKLTPKSLKDVTITAKRKGYLTGGMVVPVRR